MVVNKSDKRREVEDLAKVIIDAFIDMQGIVFTPREAKPFAALFTLERVGTEIRRSAVSNLFPLHYSVDSAECEMVATYYPYTNADGSVGYMGATGVTGVIRFPSVSVLADAIEAVLGAVKKV